MIELLPMGEYKYKLKKNSIIVDPGGFNISMPLTGLAPCMFCKNFNASIMDRNACLAFPDGIPAEIMQGKNQHRKPYEGDHGIQFEPLDPKDE